MEQKYNEISEIIMKSQIGKKEENLNFSALKIEHKGIKCEQCFKEPIIGFRYKCSECNNYNLCEDCEEKNSVSGNHPHDFIKIRKEQKNNTTIIINQNEEEENNIQINQDTINQNNNDSINQNEEGENIIQIYEETINQINNDTIDQNKEEENTIQINQDTKEVNDNSNNKNNDDTINIKQKEQTNNELNKYRDQINEFKDNYGIGDDIEDEKILRLLMENNFNYEDTFGVLFD